MADLSNLAVHGPYEDLGIAGLRVIEKVIDGQDAATKAELWKRYLEWSQPWHDVSVNMVQQLAGAINDLLKALAPKP